MENQKEGLFNAVQRKDSSGNSPGNAKHCRAVARGVGERLPPQTKTFPERFSQEYSLYYSRKPFSIKRYLFSWICGILTREAKAMEKTSRYGNKPYQKLKPYVILQYLLRESDENHIQTSEAIIAYLDEQGISAERRSIYRDIDEINLVNVMLEEECKVEQAKELLLGDPDGERKLVVYDPHKKGFYVRQRHFDLNDIRLLAECVYSAKFVSEGQAKRLVDVVANLSANIRQSESGIMPSLPTV
jgi:hypothetical protein